MKYSHFTSLHDALTEIVSPSVKIEKMLPISGGDINRAYRLLLSDGTPMFMKANTGESVDFFEAEADGLLAIAQTKTIRVPRVLGLGIDERYGAFLLLEWIEGTPPIHDYWENFGRQLAALHRADTPPLVANGSYGFDRDSFIGKRVQINSVRDSWIVFFRDCRLSPQLHDAARYLDTSDRKRADRLLARLDTILVEPARPSLIHGDLWSGNFITGHNGQAWLIDPAVYVGHAEADLAMTELFGGFQSAFYHAYREAFGMQPGYERRRDVYNLYHLLNHLNLFGSFYLPAVRRVLKEFGS